MPARRTAQDYNAGSRRHHSNVTDGTATATDPADDRPPVGVAAASDRSSTTLNRPNGLRMRQSAP